MGQRMGENPSRGLDAEPDSFLLNGSDSCRRDRTRSYDRHPFQASSQKILSHRLNEAAIAKDCTFLNRSIG